MVWQTGPSAAAEFHPSKAPVVHDTLGEAEEAAKRLVTKYGFDFSVFRKVETFGLRQITQAVKLG